MCGGGGVEERDTSSGLVGHSGVFDPFFSCSVTTLHSSYNRNTNTRRINMDNKPGALIHWIAEIET